jgi:hypothetical protein
VNVPVNAGDTVPAPDWFRPNVPAPVPTSAVTVHVVPLPVTEVMAEPVSPVAARLNAADVTFETLRLNVTVHDTEDVMLVCVHAVAQVMAVTTVAGVV